MMFCSVLGAVQAYAAKHKCLRDSDALHYLILSGSSILMSGVFLTIGIIGFILALMPVIYLTYGLAPLVIACITFSCIIPYEVKVFAFDYMARHVYFYYMMKGSRAARKLKMVDITDENHDPYDPTLAWKSYMQSYELSKIWASRDVLRSNLVIVEGGYKDDEQPGEQGSFSEISPMSMGLDAV